MSLLIILFNLMGIYLKILLKHLAGILPFIGKNLLLLSKTLKSYFKDVYAASCLPVGAGDKNRPIGVYGIFEFIERYHILAYYVVFCALMLNCRYWHLCALLFIVGEIIVIFIRPIPGFKHVWAIRIVLIVLFVRAINAHYGVHQENADALIVLYVQNLSLYALSAKWLIEVTNSVVMIDSIVTHHIGLFMVEYVPYFLQSMIIFLPLFSSIFILLTGYLIGYVLASYLATFCIFLTFLASLYLWLIYPALHQKFFQFVGNGKVSPVSFREDINNPYIIHVQQHDQMLIDLLTVDSPVHDVMSKSQNLNLVLDFSTLVDIPVFHAGFEFVLDSVSIVMVFVVTLISFIVHLYSTVYMKNDPHMVRFFALLSMFTFFMIVLVQAGNVIMLYIGWEGVGLSSFLLISFWYTRVAAVKAATKAMVINKIGDMLLVFASSILLFYSKGSTNIAVMSLCTQKALDDNVVGSVMAIDLAASALVIAAMVKSAQIFFHTWLADAMEGPTPVSALLHAATMVTAGVYLVIRFSPIIELSAAAKIILFFGGYFTIILASCIAMAQYDIKKIIAYSTCSQIGMMFFACGLSAYDYALYHFFNHAFFKCLLFLLAGGIIHQLNNEQDIRKMGGLLKLMPHTFLYFLIATLSLVGMPGFSGATSKDKILHLVNYTAAQADSWTACLFLYSNNIIIFLTAAYSFRLLYYIFFNRPSYNARALLSKVNPDAASAEAVYSFIFSFLAVMSIGGGAAFKGFFINTEGQFISIHEEICIRNPYHLEASVDTKHTAVAFILTLIMIVVSALLMHYARFVKKTFWAGWRKNRVLYTIFCFFNRKCYFDEVYNLYIVRPLFHLSYIFVYIIEGGVFNFFVYKLWELLAWAKLLRFFESRFYLMDHLFMSFGTLAAIYVLTFLIHYLHG